MVRLGCQIIIIIVCVSGCSRIYWDDNWIYDNFSTLTYSQHVVVESDPPSFAWINGTYVGQTPISLELPFTTNRIQLKKNQYKESPGHGRQVIDHQIKTEQTVRPDAHTILLKAPGYHDQMLQIKVPRVDNRIRAVLTPKAGLNFPIACTIHIQAKKDDFPFIKNILQAQSLTDLTETPMGSVPNGAGDVQQTIQLTVKDWDAFSSITERLRTEAGKRHFQFNVAESRVEASFSTNPQREFRGVWISYLDWPRAETDPSKQQKMLIDLLDMVKRLKFNAVIFHVRVEGDAYYPSSRNPWSRFLTGTQGKHPGYDPLKFAIDEAHKRGLELHAWLNPYRVQMSQRCTYRNIAPSHVSQTHPEWILRFHWRKGNSDRCYVMLDPGIPDVTRYIVETVQEIVKRYDVDGIHFDDMFYPYPDGQFKGIGREDMHTYQRYHKGRTDIRTWRRQNINGMIHQVYNAIKKEAPYVRFGVSPFGIWKTGVPTGTRGMGARDVIYSDALAWLKMGSVDYLSPQLYWSIGGNPDYKTLLAWWAEQALAYQRHVYPGQIIYYVQSHPDSVTTPGPRSIYDIIDQIHINRKNGTRNVLGNMFYRILDNQDRILGPDALRKHLQDGFYSTWALPPTMPWLASDAPLPPRHVQLKQTNDQWVLSWSPGTETQTAWKYAVYVASRYDMAEGKSPITAGRILTLTGGLSIHIPITKIAPGDALFIRTVSRNNVESPPSDMVEIPWDSRQTTADNWSM